MFEKRVFISYPNHKLKTNNPNNWPQAAAQWSSVTQLSETSGGGYGNNG